MPAWIDYAFVESASNVLLFVPLGALVVWALGRRYWWAGGPAGLLLSCLIELAQSAFLPERYPALADVIANTGGAALGGLFTLLVFALRKPVRNQPPPRTL